MAAGGIGEDGGGKSQGRDRGWNSFFQSNLENPDL